jgi:hypothetical protein
MPSSLQETSAISRSVGDAPTAVEEHVCPFCGIINTELGKPCQRCTLQDTPASRQATRQRVGPWYVLQSRNPAAPGMTFATLQSLVGKGLVTTKSVVRGPTTHQLWRLAMNVRGLSRELGLCHICGKDVETTAAVCPHCNRSQLPPADPDALLETPRTMPLPTNSPSAPPDTPVKEPTSIPATEAQTSIMDERIELAHAEHFSVREKSDRPPMEDLLTPMDLAKAFQLQYGPADPPPAAVPPPPPRPRQKGSMASSFIAVAVATIVCFAILNAPRPSHQLADNQSDSTVTEPSPAKPLPDAQLAAAVTEPRAVETVTATPPSLPTTAVEIDPPSTAIADARHWWQTALDAESRSHFADAVKAYEQIESLPNNAWPKGLHTRLALAREELAGGMR